MAGIDKRNKVKIMFNKCGGTIHLFLLNKTICSFSVI